MRLMWPFNLDTPKSSPWQLSVLEVLKFINVDHLFLFKVLPRDFRFNSSAPERSVPVTN